MDVRKHILIVTFPSFGHIMAQMQLAVRISKYHDVTMAVSSLLTEEISRRNLMPNGGGVELKVIRDGLEGRAAPESPNEWVSVIESSERGIRRLIASVQPRRKDEYSKIVYAEGDSAQVDAIIADTFITGAVVGVVEKGIPFYHHATYSASEFKCKSLMLGIEYG